MMKNKNEILAIIPVKGNSERVSKKNIKPFANTTLLDLKLNQLLKILPANNIAVSSEDEEVLKIAHKYKVICHLRDSYYSTSSVPMSEVYSYLAREFKDFTNVMWTNVTNPLANENIYKKGIEQYFEMPKEHDCLLSVTPIKDYFIFKNKYLNFERNPWPRSQDLEPLFTLNFVLNIMRMSNLEKWGSLVGENPMFVPLDSTDAMDIDFPIDFDFCEFVYKKKNNIS